MAFENCSSQLCMNIFIIVKKIRLIGCNGLFDCILLISLRVEKI